MIQHHTKPPQTPGVVHLSVLQRNVIDRHVEQYGHQLRLAALTLGGVVEHYSECTCDMEGSEHDALIVVVPEPYLSAYKKHWPEFMQKIESEINPQEEDSHD